MKSPPKLVGKGLAELPDKQLYICGLLAHVVVVSSRVLTWHPHSCVPLF